MVAVCRNCIQTFNYSCSQSRGYYCSNACQGEFKVKQRFIDGTTWKHSMRLYMIKLRCNKCECCGLEEWNNQTIVMNIDHINGKRTDNRMDNLRILCPNCHSQTETVAYRNVSEAGKERMRASARNSTLKTKLARSSTVVATNS